MCYQSQDLGQKGSPRNLIYQCRILWTCSAPNSLKVVLQYRVTIHASRSRWLPSCKVAGVLGGGVLRWEMNGSNCKVYWYLVERFDERFPPVKYSHNRFELEFFQLQDMSMVPFLICLSLIIFHMNWFQTYTVASKVKIEDSGKISLTFSGDANYRWKTQFGWMKLILQFLCPKCWE